MSEQEQYRQPETPPRKGNGEYYEEHRHTTTLLNDFSRDLTTLLGQEVALFRAEMAQKGKQITGGAGALIAGAIITFAGVLVLLDAAVVVVADLLTAWTNELWLAPLIVGLVVGIIGLVLLAKARRNLNPANLAPNRTAESLRRDSEMLRRQMR